MATPTLIPVLEYLTTSYHPDCDYVDGVLEERNVGEKPHGLLQGLLYSIFENNLEQWNLMPIIEQRVQTLATSYRVPDVCVLLPGEGDVDVVTKPPALCIEVLSEGDSLTGLQPKLDEFFQLGVPVVWIFNPRTRTAYVATKESTLQEPDILTLPGTPVRIELSSLFRKLDIRLAF